MNVNNDIAVIPCGNSAIDVRKLVTLVIRVIADERPSDSGKSNIRSVASVSPVSSDKAAAVASRRPNWRV